MRWRKGDCTRNPTDSEVIPKPNVRAEITGTLVRLAVDNFFFSSSSRHTRSYGDWSSDVCSSDLAPSYVVTPLGAKVNRVFVVGVITDVENVGSDIQPMWRARVSDPTGTFH